ncbi:TPA: hypothetical protein I8271_003845 [Kluyvera intermedia]|uniref:Uncharacterized protein n=1 Tax=Kluyvera intermedia TaxID=61648 RepID=A0A9P3T9U4_KLUIN|nr:hypothetical protein [Phytobacter ursingii]HAT2206428.1 hypothetical protein [Kluyvera intermedia]HAT2517102.1 hypothetical protein [Kluyvera intermedia]HAT2604927.1 hypothetical protein [Kluyvera intermedia]HAT2681827.1 hypothetical protein [Kluyvera intermedia]HAT2698444.1 hypothetical protein [Kluyvera intermedia]
MGYDFVPGVAALTGATAGAVGSPDKALAPHPGRVPGGAALTGATAGAVGSPDKALAPPSGKSPRWRCANRGYDWCGW